MKCARLISYKNMFFLEIIIPIYRLCLVGKWALTITLNLQIYYRSEYISFSNKSQKSAVSSPRQTYRRGAPLLNISKGISWLGEAQALINSTFRRCSSPVSCPHVTPTLTNTTHCIARRSLRTSQLCPPPVATCHECSHYHGYKKADI